MRAAPVPRKTTPKPLLREPDTLDKLCIVYDAMVCSERWYFAGDYVRLVLAWQKEQGKR